MYELMMALREGPDRQLPGALMAEAARLCELMSGNGRAVSFGDLSREFHPAKLPKKVESYAFASDVERFRMGVAFWRNNRAPVTSRRMAAALSALSSLCGDDERSFPEIVDLIAAIEQHVAQR